MMISLALSPCNAAINAARYNPVERLGADLLEYWDANEVSQFTLSGSEIITWTSGKSGLAPTQATATARPVYDATGFRGAPCAVFDGSDDFLSVSSVGSIPIGANTCEVWVLGSQDVATSEAASKTAFAYGNGSTLGAYRAVERQRVTNPSSFMRTRFGSAGATVALIGSLEDMSGPFVARSRFEAAQVLQYLNGVADGVSATAVDGTTNTRTRIGALSATTAANFWKGTISAIYVTSLLSEGKGAALQNYLMRRAGFP